MPLFSAGSLPYQQVSKPPFTIESPGYERVPGESLPRRSPKARDGLWDSPAPGVHTMWDAIEYTSSKFSDRRAVGWRNLIKMHHETKMVPKMVDGVKTEVEKKWQYFELSPYEFMTFKEVGVFVRELGSGLRNIGLQKGSNLHLFATSGPNWFGMAYACCSQSMSIVTAYDSLGPSGVEHSLSQSDATAMYIDPHLIKTAIGPLDKTRTVRTIIYNDKCLFEYGDAIEVLKEARPDLEVMSVSELRARGAQNPVDPVPPKPEDRHCIMYTSGTGGLAKGVEITHRALVSAIAGETGMIDEMLTKDEVVLCYLPSAHIFELVVEGIPFLSGACIGYGNPRTIADSSVRNCAGDIRELAPTILVGVPHVWETMKKGIQGKLAEMSPIARGLFWGALRYKSFMVARRLPFATLLDGMVFTKIRQIMGGRIRMLMNGGSDISYDTRQFLSMSIVPLINGYGLTETVAVGSLGSPVEFTLTAIGPIPPCSEIKLVSLPDLGYIADDPKKPQQGEIYVKGNALFSGYYKNEEETVRSMTPDGWFKTGDIGEWDSVGHLKVIDRTKNLVKMQGGEYIALERMEATYRSSQLVISIMAEGNGEHTRAIAVIFPNEKALAAKAREVGVSEHDMYHDKKVNDLVLKELVAVGKAGKLVPLEIIAGVVITDEEWTPVNGLVTATQKLNRKAVKERYRKEIDACYRRIS